LSRSQHFTSTINFTASATARYEQPLHSVQFCGSILGRSPETRCTDYTDI